jgi:hypothetical protein
MSPAIKEKVFSEKNHNKPYEKSSMRHGYHPRLVYTYICFRPVTIDTMLRDICLNSKLVKTEREQNIPAGSRRQRREHLCPVAPTGLDYLQWVLALVDSWKELQLGSSAENNPDCRQKSL